ncbi:MAG: ABC transporter permease [Acidimicrobiia bacterium]|nr:ABC transporter permease [Acidimicrobiia bacterium]
MFIALRDLWRSKLRFSLLAGAVGLLIFLLLFLNTLSATLLGFFIGAIENNSADVLVYEDTARRNLQASRIDPSVVGEVLTVPGVVAAAPIGELTLTATVDTELTDLSLWGVDLTGPGRPEPIVQGRLPGPGEVVVDESATAEGFEIGETITLIPSGTELEIVGYVQDRRYAVVATAYLDFTRWVDVFEQEFPGSPIIPLSLVAVEIASDEEAAVVGDRITAMVAGVEGLDRVSAASGTPGVDSISQSFTLIVGITFGIVVLVVGFFFLILTVQKLRSFVTLRAVGASTGYLAGSLIAQIIILVLLGSVFGTLLLMGATLGSNPAFPLSVDVRLVLTVTVAVLVFSVLSGLLSVRRIARADPAEAAQGTR